MNSIPGMVNSIPAIMFSWQIEKGESTFLHVSDYCQEMLGVSAQDALKDANEIITLVVQEDAASFSMAITESMCNLTLFDCQVRMRRITDGTIVTVHFKSRPRREGTATIWDGVAIEVNSAPTVSRGDTMSEDSDSSMQKAEPSPKAVAAQQLLAAERNLTEWLSHEIRNPLSVTIEALQTLQELHVNCNHVQDSYSSGECYQVITESIRYVEDLLNNMNDLDQFDMGQMPVVSSRCTVQEDILLPTYRMMERLRPRGGRVQLRMASGASTLEEDVIANVDKLRLRQVLTNLIANAFHFTTQGFVELDLRIREGPHELFDTCSFSHAPQRMLSFHVRDSGCGVKPSQYDTLFSRWEELGTSRNGTGIGLCLCQALVKAMGGDIRLNKDYNSGIPGHPGAEFVVDIPVESNNSSAPACSDKSDSMSCDPLFNDTLESALFAGHQLKMVSSSPDLQRPTHMTMSTPTSRARSYPPANARDPVYCREIKKGISSTPSKMPTVKASYFKGKYRFLIVDDEKMGRKFLKRRFSRLFPEATVVEVASGEEALAEAATNQYDVITMDHFMAIDEMNGEETIRQLRSHLKSDALIMGISGNEKQAEHLSAGADSFFQKPLPSDASLIESLQHKLAPPAGWKALILSDRDEVASMLTERLYEVASPHFTTQEQAQKRWQISTVTSPPAEEIIPRLTAESFDLVIMAYTHNENKNVSSKIRKRLRHLAENNGLVMIDCFETGNSRPTSDPASKGLEWCLSALPSSNQMRHALCKFLLADRTLPPPAKLCPESSSLPVFPSGLPPKRTNSGVAMLV